MARTMRQPCCQQHPIPGWTWPWHHASPCMRLSTLHGRWHMHACLQAAASTGRCAPASSPPGAQWLQLPGPALPDPRVYLLAVTQQAGGYHPQAQPQIHLYLRKQQGRLKYIPTGRAIMLAPHWAFALMCAMIGQHRTHQAHQATRTLHLHFGKS